VTVKISDRDNGLAAHKRKFEHNARVTVGVHAAEGGEPKAEPDGTSALTLVEVAEFHEFGLGVPQRSFVAGAVDENEAELNAKLTNALHSAVKPDGMGPEKQLERFGLYVVGVMQERISAGIPPMPLAPATLKYKASVGVGQKEIPLILTGQLRSSIRSKVEVI
jgi:hypothetical protein